MIACLLHVYYMMFINTVKTRLCWKVFLFFRDHVIFEIKLKRNHTWDVVHMTYASLQTCDFEIYFRTHLVLISF
jgi:hypothetical protein